MAALLIALPIFSYFTLGMHAGYIGAALVWFCPETRGQALPEESAKPSPLGDAS